MRLQLLQRHGWDRPTLFYVFLGLSRTLFVRTKLGAPPSFTPERIISRIFFFLLFCYQRSSLLLEPFSVFSPLTDLSLKSSPQGKEKRLGRVSLSIKRLGHSLQPRLSQYLRHSYQLKWPEETGHQGLVVRAVACKTKRPWYNPRFSISLRTRRCGNKPRTGW